MQFAGEAPSLFVLQLQQAGRECVQILIGAVQGRRALLDPFFQIALFPSHPLVFAATHFSHVDDGPGG